MTNRIRKKTLLLNPSVNHVPSGADEEAFEDNSEEYIRRDLEGSGKKIIFVMPHNGKNVSHQVAGSIPSLSVCRLHVLLLCLVLTQTLTRAAEQRATWWEASVSSSRVQSRPSSLATSTPCWENTPRTPEETGNTKTPPYIWSHRWRRKPRHRRCVLSLSWTVMHTWMYMFNLWIMLFLFFFQHGITQANELVNLTDFFVNHILSDLKSSNSKNHFNHFTKAVKHSKKLH